MRKLLVVLLLLALTQGLTSCAGLTNTEADTKTGVLAGAALGGALSAGGGGMHGWEGALLGGIVGGIAGHTVGAKKDQQEANTRVVNVPNANGSFTPVYLHLEAGGWKGPRGEFYPTVPTPAQLAPVYGLH